MMSNHMMFKHMMCVSGNCAASSDTTSRLWDINTGEAIRVYSGHHKATICCALNDGTELNGM